MQHQQSLRNFDNQYLSIRKAMEYLPLLLFVISTSITPGPNNTLILASGVNHGLKKSLPHYFGIGTGFPLMVIAIGLGAGTLFKELPVLQVFLKTIGACYLMYLAYKVGSAPTKKLDAEKKKPFTFIQAALFQFVNPKAWIMAIGAAVTFTTSTNYFSDIIIIALAYILFGMPCTGLWLLFGASLKSLLSNPAYLRIFNICMAILLATSLIPVFQELYVYSQS